MKLENDCCEKTNLVRKYMTKKKYNLLITGYYYKKNYGDDLLLDVAKKLLTTKYCSEYSFNTQVVAIDQIDNNNILLNSIIINKI